MGHPQAAARCMAAVSTPTKKFARSRSHASCDQEVVPAVVIKRGPIFSESILEDKISSAPGPQLKIIWGTISRSSGISASQRSMGHDF